MRINIIRRGLMIWLALGLAGIAFAQAQAEKERVKGAKVFKGISGEVSAISKDFIAIVYGRDVAGGSEEEEEE